MRLVVLGNPRSRRMELLSAAVARRGDVALKVVPWIDFLRADVELRALVRDGDVVRLESPGKDFEVERQVLRLGATTDDGTQGATVREIDSLVEERGRVYWPAVWYRGFCTALELATEQLAACPSHRIVNAPADIAAMFDKTATHRRLAARGVAVPPAIGRVGSFDELFSQMQERGWSRAFVKLAYGSSASGTIALRTRRQGVQAFTTVEFDGVDSSGSPQMYNTRRVRELRSLRDVSRVVDAVARHVAHAEYWLPKAGIGGRTFDVRVVVIDGKACHTVVRMSRGPMTNLHLLNQRSDADEVRRRCGVDAWAAAMSTCERATDAFPDSLYGGVDLLVRPDFRKHAVLEVNAFGDLLAGATWREMDCYEAELAALFGPAPASDASPLAAEVA